MRRGPPKSRNDNCCRSPWRARAGLETRQFPSTYRQPLRSTESCSYSERRGRYDCAIGGWHARRPTARRGDLGSPRRAFQNQTLTFVLGAYAAPLGPQICDVRGGRHPANEPLHTRHRGESRGFAVSAFLVPPKLSQRPQSRHMPTAQAELLLCAKRGSLDEPKRDSVVARDDSQGVRTSQESSLRPTCNMSVIHIQQIEHAAESVSF